MYGEDLDLGQPLMDHYQLRVPAGTDLDGAVAELSRDERGIITAGIRIPAHQPALILTFPDELTSELLAEIRERFKAYRPD